MMGLLMGIIAASGGATPVPEISFRAAYSNPTNATTYTFAATDIGAAPAEGETREVFYSVEWYQGAVATRTLSSATIGGVAATITTQHNNGVLQAMTVIRAIVPTGTTADVVLTFSNTVFSCSIAAYRVMNRVNVGTGTIVSNAVFPSVSTSGTITGIDIPAGGFALSVAGWNNTISAPAMSGITGATTDAFNTPENTGNAAHGSTGLQETASSGSPIVWTWTTSRAGMLAAWAFYG